MIKLTIKYSDKRDDWIQYFSNISDAQEWLNVEQSKYYWLSDNQVVFLDVTPIPIVPPVPSKAELDAAKWNQIRSQRDALLSACDWTMLGDVDLDNEQKAIIADYRTKLRNLPSTNSDPNLIVFPSFPKL